MNYYQEITVIKSPDISPYFIWSKLYTQIHLALVEIKDDNDKVSVGVSFPEYKLNEKKGKVFGVLGSKLRLFSNTKSELESLNVYLWLDRLTDYVHIKSIESVAPEKVNGHLIVSRHQQKLNIERLTRRYSRRKEISFEDAKNQQIERFAQKNEISLMASKRHYYQPEVSNMPYINISSLSSSQKFSLVIIQRQVDKKNEGLFNTYGLSSNSTVPNFE